MPTFNYIARNKQGVRIDGTIDAPDRNGALLSLQQEGHTPLSIIAATGKKTRPAGVKKDWKAQFKLSTNAKTRLKPRDMLLFTRELADLLASGMTLGRALHTQARRDSNPNSAIIKRLRDEVIQGSSLSDAIQLFPESFPKLYVNMVRAGEAGGALAEALTSLRTHYERVQVAQGKVTQAMIYPCIVLGVGVLSVVGLMVFIIPKFSTIFDELGGTMPLPTRILIGISNGLIHYGWLITLVIIAISIALGRYVKTPAGRRWLDGKQLNTPVVCKITRANAFALFARTLETLIRNGVPILKALAISSETVGNEVIADEITNARSRVTDGSSIAGPLAAGGVFPALLTDMLAVGEETGDLPGALSQIARRYDEELDFSIKLLTTVLEPVLILGIALIIGFVAVSMLMAVFDLTSGLGA